ncbi:MAG TPA: glycosyltransferase family protein, partial [Terriglobales bacterium]|nr:glycosyltransferase family protein [Terriglobales bacterium]
DDWKIQLVITDFEPLTCQVGRHKRLPIISIDNQHCLTNTDVSYPKQYRRDAAVAKLVTRAMVPHADAYLATSFFMPKVKKAGTFLFPPILRREILQAKPIAGEHVLVYVTSPAPSLAKLLSEIRGSFVAYGFGREGNEGNIVFKAPSLNGFLKDLISCKAIIANAGFSLVTEALHLAKPYLAIPVKHQFEQIFNAYWLDKMGYGAYWEDLNKERVESFLYNIPRYAEKLAVYSRQGNQALLKKVDALIAEYTESKR